MIEIIKKIECRYLLFFIFYNKDKFITFWDTKSQSFQMKDKMRILKEWICLPYVSRLGVHYYDESFFPRNDCKRT